ncbi:MAG: hypothetical protein R2754_01165 [Microthrixaceae bacterium]
MLVAEQEIFISRPFAPTRRVALGESNLPSHPAPGAGGLLLAGVVAHFSGRIDADLIDDQLHLIAQLEEGHRITQPRLRHRLQTDHVGLQRCHHKLWVKDDRLSFDIDDHTGTAEQHVLCALYGAAQLPLADRRGVFAAVRVGLRWPGDVDAGFAALVTGRRNGSQLSALADPESWARTVLGFEDGVQLSRRQVQVSFRQLVAAAHPDHGGETLGAAGRISDLSEARRVLLATTG